MNRSDIEQIVFVSVSVVLGEEESKPIYLNANLRDDLGLSDQDCADLRLDVEEKFGVEIPDIDWLRIVTVGDLVGWLVLDRPDENTRCLYCGHAPCLCEKFVEDVAERLQREGVPVAGRAGL